MFMVMLIENLEETDLEITIITPSMNFSSQVNKSYTQAMQALLTIKRSFKFLTNNFLNQACAATGRTHLVLEIVFVHIGMMCVHPRGH